MTSKVLVLSFMLMGPALAAVDEHAPNYPSFDYEKTRTHEIQPHRRTIPLAGVKEGFNQLRVSLIVSATGHIIDAKPTGDPELLKLWPQLQDEVRAWEFMPFTREGKPVVAQAEEYIDLVPPERLPDVHRTAPTIGPNSTISIVLKSGDCYGSCPSYEVTVSTGGIEYFGHSCVGALGKRSAPIDSESVRKLAAKFTSADFYSLDDAYESMVTDVPFYSLSISIDGQKKEVTDYVGRWVGMPGIVRELESEVDKLAQTSRWIQVRGGKSALKKACMARR